MRKLSKAENRILVGIIVNGRIPKGAHSRVWLGLISDGFIEVNPSHDVRHGHWKVNHAGRSALAKVQS